MTNATEAARALNAQRWAGTSAEERSAVASHAARCRWATCAGCDATRAVAGPLEPTGDPDSDTLICRPCRSLAVFAIRSAGGCTHPLARQAEGWHTADGLADGACLPCVRGALVSVRRYRAEAGAGGDR